MEAPACNRLPGTLLGMSAGRCRVRLAGGAEVLAGRCEAQLFAGAAVVLMARPADVGIVPASSGSAGTVAAVVSRVGRAGRAMLVRVDLAGTDVAVTARCPADAAVPSTGATVGLVFDPARTRVAPAPDRPPMRRGPDGPFLVDLA